MTGNGRNNGRNIDNRNNHNGNNFNNNADYYNIMNTCNKMPGNHICNMNNSNLIFD